MENIEIANTFDDVADVQELDLVRFGVDQARRGWCESPDVANTYHLAALRKLLKK